MTLVQLGQTVYDLCKISDLVRPKFDPQLTVLDFSHRSHGPVHFTATQIQTLLSFHFFDLSFYFQ